MPTTASLNPKLSAEKTVFCHIVNQDDKHQTIFELKTEDETSIQKSFVDIEKVYEKVKNSLPASFDRPPKKKFLVAENKFVEKRKLWVEAFVNHLIAKHYENYDVQIFFGHLLISPEENFVYLGPSEKKSIKPSQFDYLKTIGQGSFGRVFMVRHHGDGKVYAMKVLGKEHIKMRNEVKHVMAERNVLLSNINHPFLVSLHYSFQTKDKLYFVLDFLNGGELFFHLQRERCFSETRARFYAAEIASALGYLHQNDIIYRDLKPENLLLDRLGHVVLTDFGLCKEGIKSKDTTNTYCGTPEYLAPEVIRKKPYDRTVDWWCLGSVLYEMLFGLPPFYSKNQHEMYEKTLYQPLTIPSAAPPTAKDILSKMLNKDPSCRLGAKSDFAEIQEHQFFISIDWEKLLNREVKAPFIPKVRCDTDTVNISKEFVDIEPNQDQTSMATHKLNFFEKMAVRVGPLYRYHSAQMPRRMDLLKKVFQRELAPPTKADWPAIKKDFAHLVKALESKEYKNLSVREALVYSAVFVEIVCLFFVGEIIGRRNINGYLVDSSYVGKPQKKAAAAIQPEDKTSL